MTTIRATCPDCGDVDLTPGDLRLEVLETLAAPERLFSFHCRGCEAQVVGEASSEAARSLERAGVVVRHVRLPAEAREPHEGPRLTEDDLIAFGLRLQAADDPIGTFRHA